MLKDALARWIAPSITGQVTLELRRGDDYTIVSTAAPHMAYDPHKLSMEKVESMFSPEDRMGALEMQNLSVLDNRAFLIDHLDATRALAGAGAGAPRELTEILGEDQDNEASDAQEDALSEPDPPAPTRDLRSRRSAARHRAALHDGDRGGRRALRQGLRLVDQAPLHRPGTLEAARIIVDALALPLSPEALVHERDRVLRGAGRARARDARRRGVHARARRARRADGHRDQHGGAAVHDQDRRAP